jgi:hypothetical protein
MPRDNQLLRYFLFFLFLFTLPLGCTDLEPAHLVALELDHAPTAADWDAALPKTVNVKGGRLNEVDPLPAIDQDTVHTSTASCHHGSALPAPIAVDMRAFYTAQDLYLRLSWDDATRNDNMRGWTYTGQGWQSSGDMEDGIGLLWDIHDRYPDFTCSYACHLDDFGVSGQSFRGHNRMKLFKAGPELDLWNWKAGRTGRLAFADDRFIDANGMQGDQPGEIFQVRPQLPNRVFGEGDRPLYDFDGNAIDGLQATVFSRAPGYLTDPPAGDRADVRAWARWQNGRWVLILRRALNTHSARDVQFQPSASRVYHFGLSLMDNSLYEHYASTVPLGLILRPRSDSVPSAR